MSQVDNILDIAFSTAFAIDKLFPEKYSGSFSVGASAFPTSAGNIVTSTISHNRGANVLPVMQFSVDGTSWYDAGSKIFTAGGSLTNSFSATCYTTSTTIVIVGQNFTSGAQTCNYRVLLISDD